MFQRRFQKITMQNWFVFFSDGKTFHQGKGLGKSTQTTAAASPFEVDTLQHQKKNNIYFMLDEQTAGM